MKILYVLNDTFKKGGTESVIFNYYNNIDHSKFQIDFIIHTTKEEAEHNSIYNTLINNGVIVHCVTPRSISVRKNISDINSVFKSNKYRIIHSHADCANSFILSLAKKNNIPIRIAHSHNTKIPIYITNLKNLLHVAYLQFSRFKLRYVATHYMACSDCALTWLFGKRNIFKRNVYILHNAIDIDRFKFNKEIRDKKRKELGIQKEFVIGHVGRFADQKNHIFMLDILKDIIEIDKNVKLVFVGDGPNLNKIKSLAKIMNLEPYILFLGSLENVADILQVFDVFILPSIYEGLSVSIIEAQANGLPCLVSDSKKISKESAVTPLVSFIPLKCKMEWVNQIMKKVSRDDYSEMLKMSGFDIQNEVKKLEAYYERL